MLAVALLFCVSQVAAIPLANFYPFGTSAGDNTLGPTDDGRSPLIALNDQFLYFGTYYTDLRVSVFTDTYKHINLHIVGE